MTSLVGDGIYSKTSQWSFSGNVPDNFVEHATRSIPFYYEGHGLTTKLSEFFVRENSYCYEIGTSTGQLLQKLAKHHEEKPNCVWIGIDTEESMIAKAQDYCEGLENIELYHSDFLNLETYDADLIVSYYTLQFIPPKIRQEVYDKIYSTLSWGGGFILFEKIRASDARFQDIFSILYTQFKIDNNFTSEEIINKTLSLKGVLEPFSSKGNVGMLERAGFVDLTTIFQFGCFEGVLAIK